MPRFQGRLALPTTAPLPHNHVLPSLHPAVLKVLGRNSRPALIELALSWLNDRNVSRCPPYLASEDDGNDEGFGSYDVCESVDECREVWEEMREKKGSKKDVLERIIEGDWRAGVSLSMLAEADIRYLADHSTSTRWTATRLVRVVSSRNDGNEDIRIVSEEQPEKATLPRFHGQSFVQHLHSELSPVIKAHFYLSRLKTLPITILRVQCYESPYNTTLDLSDSPAILDASKTIYLAFPDGTPYIYISLTTGTTADLDKSPTSLRSMILSAIPKAFSKPQERYSLKPTSLSARSLAALLSARGAGKSNNAQGGWSIYVDGNIDNSPLDPEVKIPAKEEKNIEENAKENTNSQKKNGLPLLQKRQLTAAQDEELIAAKRRKLVAESRFGPSAKLDDGKGLDRFEVRLEDLFQKHTHEDDAGAVEEFRPHVKVVFAGNHVFAGVRKLVESGVIDGLHLPGFLTGEEGVSIGVVRHGRLIGRAGHAMT